jgi:hypothetical protein
MLLHIRLAETDETIREAWFKLSDFLKLGDSDIELSLFVGLDASLHVLGGVGG